MWNLKKNIRLKFQTGLYSENLDENFDINRGWESIRGNIKTPSKDSIGYYESKQHKPWFDDVLKITKSEEAVKLQQLQNPNQMNGDNMNNVRYETSRIFWNNNKEYLKDKINELELKRKNKYKNLYRAIINFRWVINLELTW
jgi:hypothetical protein